VCVVGEFLLVWDGCKSASYPSLESMANYSISFDPCQSSILVCVEMEDGNLLHACTVMLLLYKLYVTIYKDILSLTRLLDVLVLQALLQSTKAESAAASFDGR